MPAFAAILTKIIGTMGKKKTLTAMKSLGKTVETFKKVGGAAGGLKSSLERLGGSPVIAAFKYLIAQFKAGTSEAQMRLFKEMLELFQSRGGQLAINALIDLVVVMMKYAGTIINMIDTLMNGNWDYWQDWDWPGNVQGFITGLSNPPNADEMIIDPIFNPPPTTIGGLGDSIIGNINMEEFF